MVNYFIDADKADEQEAYWAMEEARSGLGYTHTRKDLADAIRKWRKIRRRVIDILENGQS